MQRFKNILYVLDRKSLGIDASAEKVAKLARLNEARVTGVVVDETAISDDLGFQLQGRYQELREEIHRQRLTELAKAFSSPAWDDIRFELFPTVMGNFIPVVKKVLRDSHDLIIKEKAPGRGIDQLAMRLVRKCPCPVWLIRGDVKHFRRILAALDFDEQSPGTGKLNKKIVELTYSLAQREKGVAHYLHAWHLEYESMLRGPRLRVPPEEIEKMKNEIFTRRQSQLRQLLTDNRIDHEEQQVHIDEGMFVDVIDRKIAELNVDVVVLGSVARTGIPGLLIGNKAEKLLSTISCTVLTVKPDEFISPVTLD